MIALMVVKAMILSLVVVIVISSMVTRVMTP